MSYLSYQYLAFVFLLFLVYYIVPAAHRWKVLLFGNAFFLISVSSLSRISVFLVIYAICFFAGKALSVLPEGSQRKKMFVIAAGLVSLPFMISRFGDLFGGGA